MPAIVMFFILQVFWSCICFWFAGGDQGFYYVASPSPFQPYEVCGL